MLPSLLIEVAADKYTGLLQSHFTQEWLPTVPFSGEDKSQKLVGDFFLSSVKGVLAKSKLMDKWLEELAENNVYTFQV